MYKESANWISGYQWTLGVTKDVTMEQFWGWEKVESIDGLG